MKKIIKEDGTGKKISLSVKKAVGTLSKVESMMERQDSCIAIVQQMDAAIGLIRSARKTLVGKRLEECFSKTSKDKTRSDFSEVLRLYEIAHK